jgi:acyl-homoserine-lactone acylase
VLAVLVVALLGAGCTGGDEGAEGAGGGEGDPAIPVGPAGYGAVITRTADGVPHIRARDLEGVLFGQGWASAEDHPCDLVDQVLKVQSLRAATFGPGEDDANVSSDFGWKMLGVADRARLDWERESATTRSIVESFVAGWNAQIETVGDDGVDDWCGAAGWMRRITAEELYAYARSVPLLASGARLAGFVAAARPPGEPPAKMTEGALRWQPGRGSGGPTTPEPGPMDGSGIASNGWAIGSERSATRGGMVLGNPHFPWIGELRFWEVHLSTDDGLDVYGAQLLGLPLVGIGFTEGMAWTHTVSAGRRFTAYQMQLDPADPTRYLFDGRSVPMTPHEITVEVRAEDGSTSPLTRTYWSTQFGPVINFPGVGWTEEATVSYRDANFDNADFIEMYLDIDRAGSLDDLVAAQRKHQAVPLFNTVAAGADGRTWYADTAATPYLSEEALAAYQQRLEAGGLTKLVQASNAVLLEGNTSRDEWVDDPEAPWPGVLPWSKLPMIERTDYVMNANDSYWVPNATAFIAGDFSPLQGLAGTARSVRTRQNLAVLDDRSPSGPSGEDGRFTLEELTDAALLDGAYTEVQWRAGVVQRCRSATAAVTSLDLLDGEGAVVVPSRAVDLPATGACEVLAGWDGLYDVDSRGAVLWRETVARIDNTSVWATPFDPAQPATTPNGLASPATEGPDPVLAALASSVALLEHAGIPLDVALGEVQYDARLPEEHLAVPGGLGQEGVTNVVTDVRTAAGTLQQQPELPEPLVKGSTLTAVGYPINYGTSFLMAVELTDEGPRARTILTYGETGDPELPGFSSQMEDFAQKRWKPVRFTQADIAADPDARVEEVSA